MKSEAWIVLTVGVFFLLISPVYWIMSHDPTGTTALFMTFLLCALIGFYLAVVAKQIPLRPEDQLEGEIADGAGEQGFFPPYSWWPLFCGLAFAVIVLGVAVAWWLFVIGLGVGFLAVCGWIFEYYRGIHAH